MREPVYVARCTPTPDLSPPRGGGIVIAGSSDGSDLR